MGQQSRLGCCCKAMGITFTLLLVFTGLSYLCLGRDRLFVVLGMHKKTVPVNDMSMDATETTVSDSELQLMKSKLAEKEVELDEAQRQIGEAKKKSESELTELRSELKQQ